MIDSTWITLISLGVTVLFMLGVPVFLVIAYWVIGCSLVLGMTFDNIGAALTYAFSNGFALLAMPLFILTGDLINKAGIARRLSDFAYAVLGWLRGGLAMAALGACGLFAAISGSNSATTATIGSMMHPEMVKGGYDTRFAAATAAAVRASSRPRGPPLRWTQTISTSAPLDRVSSPAASLTSMQAIARAPAGSSSSRRAMAGMAASSPTSRCCEKLVGIRKEPRGPPSPSSSPTRASSAQAVAGPP